MATLRDPRFLIFLGVWLGINMLFGLGTLPIAGEGQDVAWQAHIGGFSPDCCCSPHSILLHRTRNSTPSASGSSLNRARIAEPLPIPA